MGLPLSLGLLLLATAPALAAPGHPVFTEIYQDPPGPNDGPVGRDGGNLHQEFVEIYLPTLADLDPGLAKDGLAITVYNVEGDGSSPGLGLVNFRIDLPLFDLDPGNGLSGLPRPASGLVVLGWVDYVGSPVPTGLAGTASTRVAQSISRFRSRPGSMPGRVIAIFMGSSSGPAPYQARGATCASQGARPLARAGTGPRGSPPASSGCPSAT